MADLNVIGLVEIPNERHLMIPYQSEPLFCLFISSMSTENKKLLQQYFDEKAKLEVRKWEILDEKIRSLIRECDEYSNQLRELKKMEFALVEEKKQYDVIKTIEMEIQKNVEKVTNLQNFVKEIEKKIDKVNEKINEMINGMK